MKYIYFIFISVLLVLILADIKTNPIRKEIRQVNLNQCEEKRGVAIVGKVIIPTKHNTCNDSN